MILGSDYTFRAIDRPFKLSAELYYKNLANIIPYEIDNLKLVYSGRNESSGYVAGIDFKVFGQFVKGTDSWISFSLMKTQENLNELRCRVQPTSDTALQCISPTISRRFRN